jgi:hypothetical protein
MRRPGWGLFYLLTAGGFVIGWLYDGIRLAEMVRYENQGHRNIVSQRKLRCPGDAHCLALISLTGIFGFHHRYLGRRFFANLYLFSFGLLGIGWLVDLFRTPSLARQINNFITFNVRKADE